MQATTFTMPDGRQVGFAQCGAADGIPVVWCHGGPGCRREPENLHAAAAAAGLRLVAIERPGYGLSTPQPGRNIGSWVDDALRVADSLGIGRFATVGISTGGAYALATAARSARVLAAVACCAVTDMRWAEGRAMMPLPEQVWNAPNREAAMKVVAAQMGEHGEGAHLDAGLIPLAPSDAELFADPAWAGTWAQSIPEMFAHGVAGYADDRIADGKGWITFDVRQIACPVAVLHGTLDTMVPVAQAHHTQRLVPGATLALREGLGHFSILTAVVPVVRQLLDDQPATDRSPSSSS